MARVLLGLEDAPLTAAERLRADPTVSRLGGQPDWWPPADRGGPACSLCERPLPLVAQVYAPIGASVYHRTLYIFGCVGTQCANRSEAWCCLRVQSRAAGCGAAESAAVTAPGTTAASASDWLDSADDWGEDEEDSSGHAGLPDQMGNMALDDDNGNSGVAAACQQTTPATAELEPAAGEDGVSPEPVAPPSQDLRALITARPPPPPGLVLFRPAYITVMEEPTPQKCASHHELELLKSYQSREGINFAQLSTAAGPKGGGDERATAAAESYESAAPAHGDRLLYKLKSRLELVPEQLLRYCRDGGAPLPLQPLPAALPRCRHCGGAGTFELQLLPTLVSRLVVDSRPAQAGVLEFGTVLVYTCRDSCWQEGDLSRTETVLVQAEL